MHCSRNFLCHLNPVHVAGALKNSCTTADDDHTWIGPPRTTALLIIFKAKPGPPTAYSMSFLPNLPIICGRLMYSWRIIGNCWIIPIKSYKPSMQHEVFFHLRTSVLSILNSVWNITLSYPSVLAEHLWSHSLSISYHLLESRTVFGSV